jgi:isoleucyl-tRNA synthetase
MSKSLGNVTAPQEIIKKFGADIIRLWVAAEDYRDDVRISDEILKRLVESYRRLRNTARFLIGNLHDFDPSTDAVEPEALMPLDRWILDRTQRLLGRCLEAFDKFEFHAVYHALNNYCSVDLSSLYLDIVKDRLYCEAPDSADRRSAQTALHGILQTLVHLMAPVISFTAEEIWEHAPGPASRPDSILLSPMPEPDPALSDPALAAEWELRLDLRGEVLKGLEVARQCGAIGHSLDARVVLYPDAYENAPGIQELLRGNAVMPWEDVFIVSQVAVVSGEPSGELVYPESKAGAGEKHEGAADGAPAPGRAMGYASILLGGAIGVYAAEGGKCERCWKYHPGVGSHAACPGVCPRCAEVLRSLPQAENAHA